MKTWWLRNELKSSQCSTDLSMWDSTSCIFRKRLCKISTTITSRESSQIQRYYLPIQIFSPKKDFLANKHLFNFYEYEKETPFYDDQNKKVIDKMKDEFNEEIIEEFFGLRANMY